MRGLADLAVMIDGGSCVDNLPVANPGLGIEYGASHDCNPTPETHGGGDASLRADRVDELKSERCYSRGHFSPQRIVAEGDKTMPDALRIKVRQNVIASKDQNSNDLTWFRVGIRTTNDFVMPLGSD